MKYFLIIDPYLKNPAEAAIHTIQALHAELTNSILETSFLEIFSPSVSQSSLSSFLNQRKAQELLGVISLGSYAHIHENRDWVNQLGLDLKTDIFLKKIPFLGICFSHQLVAHLFGEKIEDAKPNGESFEEFRSIEILHPKLQALLPSSNTFFAQARYKQEVKTLESSELELAATSSNCKIEAIVHKTLPIFTFQSHLEEDQKTKLGLEILKNFMKNAQTQSLK